MFPKRNYDFNYQLPASVSGLTSIDDIQKVSPFFTQTNPVTYAIFLQANETNLSEYEISQTKSLMNHLIAKEQEAMKAMAEFLKDKREYETDA
jgi:glycyl-tRNA synthetase alpha subunit